jgi:hypothetical protein
MGADSAKILVSNHRLLDEWTPADTLPNIINFTTVQQSPYLLNDGVTLYFAAKDSNGIGDLDIYVSRYNMTTETYTLPENLGMPYNSPANEYMLLLDEAKKIGYLATDRFAKKGYVHIYSFLLSQQKRYYMPSDSLVAYARLECFEKAQMIDVQSDVDTLKTEETEPITDLNLVINDTIIYHSMSDFRDPLSKEKYVEWQSLVHQLESEQQQLSELRVQYAKAEKQVQDELTTLILRLEDNQTQLRNSSNILLQEIRKIEMSAR